MEGERLRPKRKKIKYAPMLSSLSNKAFNMNREGQGEASPRLGVWRTYRAYTYLPLESSLRCYFYRLSLPNRSSVFPAPNCTKLPLPKRPQMPGT